MDPVALTRALVDIDSTTGLEGDAGTWLADYLGGIGFSVTTQPVDGHRFNVLATIGTPQIVFSTHVDCVPPFFPSRVDGDRLFGRGSCDAKGILAAQVAAVERLRASGESRVGLVLVVGEERGGSRLSIPDQRRADRQPARVCHARDFACAAARVGPRRAFVVPGAGR